MRHFTRVISVVVALFFFVAVAVPTPTHAQTGGLLAKVKARGKLVCGINNGVPGFGFVDTAKNTISGFDTDFCRVVAAAIFGDATKVDFKPIAAADRFTALQSSEIDLLVRNTTFTFDRDTKQGADFGPTIFYDGQTVMARGADKLKELKDLKDLTVCAIKGTTTEQNISDAMAAINTTFKLVTFDNIDQVLEGFSANRCDAVTSDRSQLVSKRATSKDPTAWIIFDANLSKEPLTPAIKAGDSEWGDVVRWAVYATIIAEEQGVTQKNVDDMSANSKNPEVRRLLGTEGKFNENLGLDKGWAIAIIKQVGNYGEIYDRNLGANTPFNLARGLNNLWTQGGLIYAPPYR
ncbi:MAG: amino acid ABC transporter substrate-binding protein [Chloroflexota bacterium]